MNKLKKTGFYFLGVAALLDFLTPYVLGFFYPTLNQMTQVISLFGEECSPVRFPFLVWSVIVGCLYTLSLPAILDYFSTIPRWYRFLPTLSIAFYGIGESLFTGIFSVNTQLESWNFSTWMHNLGSGIGYPALLFFPFFLMLNFQAAKKTKEAGFFRLFFCFNLLVALCYGIARFPAISTGTIFSPLGFWQRLSFFCNDLAVLSFAIYALLKPLHPVTELESF